MDEKIITIIVNSGAIDSIETDPQFGKNLARAIRANELSNKPIMVHAGCCVDAAMVAIQHPNDEVKVLTVGFSNVAVLSDTINLIDHTTEQSKVLIIKDIVTRRGFYLRTKPDAWLKNT